MTKELQTIREVLQMVARELRTPSEPPQTHLEWLACKALAACDTMAPEPSEDAPIDLDNTVARIRDHVIMRDEFDQTSITFYMTVGQAKKELTTLIEADRQKVREECANKAVEYVFFEGDNDPIDENGFKAPSISTTGLRAAIEGDENEKAAQD